MIEIDDTQLKQLDAVRQDELIEKILLEVRKKDAEWLKRKGERVAFGYLKSVRDDAWRLGLRTPEAVERFLRFGLLYPEFNKDRYFIAWMKRHVDDGPEQRFRDFESVVDFVRERQTWHSYSSSGYYP